MNALRRHVAIVAVLLIFASLGYSALAVLVPETATALALGFIAVVCCGSAVLRYLRRV